MWAPSSGLKNKSRNHREAGSKQRCAGCLFCPLTFNGLHSITSPKIELFTLRLYSGVRGSSPWLSRKHFALLLNISARMPAYNLKMIYTRFLPNPYLLTCSWILPSHSALHSLCCWRRCRSLIAWHIERAILVQDELIKHLGPILKV
jgi:hypothetical protein